MFCDWLRMTRERLGLTQQELGELAGVSASAIGMYEQGRRRPGRAAGARLRGYFRERGYEMPELPLRPEKPAEQRFREEVVGALGAKAPGTR